MTDYGKLLWSIYIVIILVGLFIAMWRGVGENEHDGR